MTEYEPVRRDGSVNRTTDRETQKTGTRKHVMVYSGDQPPFIHVCSVYKVTLTTSQPA